MTTLDSTPCFRVVLGVLALTFAWRLSTARAVDASAAPILQIFEARWETIENRMADVFDVGYGRLWLPPPTRADSGDQSVGYDVYDRFDLGQPRRETLYGTETSLKTLINQAHRAHVSIYTDLILNHSGFSDLGTVDDFGTANTSDDVTFAQAGGYPGFAITLPGDVDGDYHGAFEGGDLNGRLAGLIDIAQEKNHTFIRHPITPGDPNNLPAGVAAAFGRIANVPTATNTQFYPDNSLGGTQLDVDPGPGESFITRFDYNLANPLAGDPVLETAEQLLLRNAQWMVQAIGVDGFRLDAVKHFPTNTLTLLDQAVFRANPRLQLDGSYKPVFSFGEVLDGNRGFLQNFINKSLPNPAAIDPSDFQVSGNRDVLDFPLFFALRGDLTGSGADNNWHGIRNASQDVQDDGLHNGTQGVSFVDSHDHLPGGFPFLKNVAYAYTLLRPGNALVYLNAEEFGPGRDFPNDGKIDALGGVFGETIAKLVEIRNTHGRGNFHERWIDEAFGDTNGDGQRSNIYIYERENSAVVGLNNRNDAVIETRNGVQTAFVPGAVLVELTGNAADAAVDPGGIIPDAVRVNGAGQINVSIPANDAHGRGYVIYGLARPEGTLSLTNVASTFAGATPSAATNGTARLADIGVITADSFDVQLNTTPVTLPAPEGESNPVRDEHADGDTALLKIDGGIDVNSNPGVDVTAPGNVAYGFEEFTGVRSPGYVWNGSSNIGTGGGAYEQTIDATQLAEGRHYLTVRAFRHRDAATGGDGGPAVFSDFKRTIYIDRLDPDSELVSFAPFASSPGNSLNRDLIVRNPDGTADNMHFFLDLPANVTNAQIMQMVQNGVGDAGDYDRDSFIFGYFGVKTGNHAVTVVTFEPTGNSGIERFAGVFTATSAGAGFGDLDGDNLFEASDLVGMTNGSFEDVLYSQNDLFHAAADVNGDGLVDNRDLFALGDELVAGGANQAVLDVYDDVLLRRGDMDQDGETNGDDVAALHAAFGGSGWLEDLNVDGTVDLADVETLITDMIGTSRADFDLDRKVAGSDFLSWQRGFNSGNRFDQGDADLDGSVGASDLATWENDFGAVTTGPLAVGALLSPEAASIPEPNVALLLVAGWASMRLAWNEERRER